MLTSEVRRSDDFIIVISHELPQSIVSTTENVNSFHYLFFFKEETVHAWGRTSSAAWGAFADLVGVGFFPRCSAWVRWLLSKSSVFARLPLSWSFGKREQAPLEALLILLVCTHWPLWYSVQDIWEKKKKRQLRGATAMSLPGSEFTPQDSFHYPLSESSYICSIMSRLFSCT